MQIFLGVMLFLMGLCGGSFINMLVYRTAVKYGLNDKRATINDKRSVCDFCGRQLSWYENIPVISWLFLKGKTRCCKKNLPWEYPLVELGMGILFLITNYELPASAGRQINNYLLIVNLIMVTLLVFSFVFDLEYMILPDFSTLILFVSALALWLFSNFGQMNYVWSGLGAGGFLLALHVGTKGRGLGMGDAKLAVFMGLFLGWPKIIAAFYFAFIVGAIIGVVLMLMKKVGRKTMIPFGPFLIGGTIISWWFGDWLLKSVKLFL